MRQLLFRLALVVTCAYAFVWGVSWLAGDQSSFEAAFTDDGLIYSRYPGVFAGGLPPQPWPDSDAPQALAAVAGAVGIFAIAGSTLAACRRRRRSSPPE